MKNTAGIKNLRLKDSLNCRNAPADCFHLENTYQCSRIATRAARQTISLNDTLTKFFPGFPLSGITVKMLLVAAERLTGIPVLL